MKTEAIMERISTPVSGRVVGNVIRGAKLIGFESRNGRSYPAATLKAALSHYEGVAVNVDHPARPQDSRSIRDRIGVIKNARFVEGSGIHGDFHVNPKHAVASQVLWDAEHSPNAVGFSHNANLHITRSGGKSIVESITGVRSMDLVADPATTSGFFESVSNSQPATLTVEAFMDRMGKPNRITPEYFIQRVRQR